MAETLTSHAGNASDSSSITTIRESNPLHLTTVRIGIAPDATVADLLDDAACLLSAGLDAFTAMTDSACGRDAPQEITDGWWAAMYTLRAGLAVFSEGKERAINALRLFDIKAAQVGSPG